ncbi:MAG: hypothetical protein AAF804_09570 [Bacteroidota bacterium]
MGGIIFSHCLHAQIWSRTAEDVIHLKNGGTLRGEIILQDTDQSITLRLYDGQEITLYGEEIDQVEKQVASFRKYKPRYYPGLKPKKVTISPGFYRSLKFGLGFGSDQNGAVTSPYFDLGVGYRFKSWLMAGLGTGLNGYSSGLILPVYADISGSLLSRRISPFYQVQVGYGFATSLVDFSFNAFEGGWMFHPALGVMFQHKPGKSWGISLGYKAQQSFESYSEFRWLPNGNRQEILISGTRLFQRITFQLSFYQ